MINAGAILVCSLLKTLVKPDMTLAEKFDFTMNYFEVNIDRHSLYSVHRKMLPYVHMQAACLISVISFIVWYNLSMNEE